jgi:hypothetical protein
MSSKVIKVETIPEPEDFIELERLIPLPAGAEAIFFVSLHWGGVGLGMVRGC